MARTSFTLVMLGVAGAMALLLGVVGIYGVIAYSVSQRRREIGIRMALGAQQPTLTGMFVRHGLFLTGIGVVCGLVVAFIIMRLMSTLAFQGQSHGPANLRRRIRRPHRHRVPGQLFALAPRRHRRPRRSPPRRISTDRN